MGLIILMTVALVLGVAAALTGTPPPQVMEPLLAGAFIAIGAFSGFAAYRERVLSRAWRIRQALLGAMMVTIGTGLLLPPGYLKVSLQIAAFALMAASLVLSFRSRATLTR